VFLSVLFHKYNFVVTLTQKECCYYKIVVTLRQKCRIENTTKRLTTKLVRQKQVISPTKHIVSDIVRHYKRALQVQPFCNINRQEHTTEKESIYTSNLDFKLDYNISLCLIAYLYNVAAH
jgi:hypothetical protein